MSASSNPRVSGVKRKTAPSSSSSSSHYSAPVPLLPPSSSSSSSYPLPADGGAAAVAAAMTGSQGHRHSATASSSASASASHGSSSSHAQSHWILPEDSGIIRCLCSFDHDDGFTIQCDRCFAWLHGSCVGFSPEQEEQGTLPDEWVCQLCRNGGRVDPGMRQRANRVQKVRLQQAAALAAQAGSLGLADEGSALALPEGLGAGALAPLAGSSDLRERSGASATARGAFRGSPSGLDAEGNQIDLTASRNTLEGPPISARAQAGASGRSPLGASIQERGKASGRRSAGADAFDARGTPTATATDLSSIDPSGTLVIPLPLPEQAAGGRSRRSAAPAQTGQLPGLATWSTADDAPAHGQYEPDLDPAAYGRPGSKSRSPAHGHQQDEGRVSSPAAGTSESREKKSSLAALLHATNDTPALVETDLSSSVSLSAKAEQVADEMDVDPALPLPALQPASQGLYAAPRLPSAKQTQQPRRRSAGNALSAIGIHATATATAAAEEQRAPLRASRARTQASAPTPAPVTAQEDGVSAGAEAGAGDSTDSESFYIEGDSEEKERYEPWMFEYTPVDELRWTDKALKEECSELVRRYLEEEPAPAQDIEEMVLHDAAAPKSATATGPGQSLLAPPHTLAETHAQRLRTASPAPSSGSSTPTGTGSGAITPSVSHSRVASALSAPLLPVIITSPLTASQASSLSAHAALYIKPLASTALSLAPPTCTPFSAPSCPISLMNPYPRPTVHAAFANASHPAGGLIALMHGEVTSGDEYRRDPMNQWEIAGAGKNYTRFVGLPWDLVLDQRRYADESRFIRQGCHPNVFVRPVIVRRSGSGAGAATAAAKRSKKRKTAAATASSGAGEYELAFGLYAIHDISKREELVLPKDWADDHVLHALHTLLFSPELVFPSLPLGAHRGGGGSSSSEEDDGVPSTSSYTYLTAGQRASLAACTSHMYALSRLAARACITLLGEGSPCACEKRRDCALAWLWKLAGASETSSKHRASVIKPQDFDLNALKAAVATAMPSLPGNTRGKSGGNAKRKANIGPLVGLPRGWKTSYSAAGTGDGTALNEISAIPPPPISRAPSPLPVPARPKSKQQNKKKQPPLPPPTPEPEPEPEVEADPEPAPAEAEMTANVEVDLTEGAMDVDEAIVEPAADASMQLSETQEDAVPPAESKAPEPILPAIMASAEAASAEAAAKDVAQPAAVAVASDSDSESDLTEPLPSEGEDARPAPSAAGKKGRKAPPPAAGKKTPAPKARPKLKAAGSSRGKKVIREDSSDDDESEKDKQAKEKQAEESDGDEQQAPEPEPEPEPEAKKGKGKAKRPSLGRKDSGSKSKAGKPSTSAKEPDKEDSAPKAPERFKAKTKSGSTSKSKDKDPDAPRDKPANRPAGGLPAFRKKSTIDEERKAQLASPATAVTPLPQVLQRAVASATMEQPAVEKKNEGPDLASLLFDAEVDMAPVKSPAPGPSATSIPAVKAVRDAAAGAAADAGTGAAEMQVDEPAAARPAILQAAAAAAAPVLAPPSPPPPAPVPEPPRRVSFMAYKARNLTVSKALPSPTASAAAIVEEPSQLSPATAEPAVVLDKPIVQTPAIERRESELVPAELEAMANSTLQGEQKPAEAASAASAPPQPPAPEQQPQSAAPAASAPALPAAPTPKARLSFAAYRQRLSTTPAAPSEEAVSAAPTVATPKSGTTSAEQVTEPVAENRRTQEPIASTAPPAQEPKTEKTSAPSDPSPVVQSVAPAAVAKTLEQASQPARSGLQSDSGPEMKASPPQQAEPVVEIQKTEPVQDVPMLESGTEQRNSNAKPSMEGDAIEMKPIPITEGAPMASLAAKDAPMSLAKAPEASPALDDERTHLRRESATPPPRGPAQPSQAPEDANQAFPLKVNPYFSHRDPMLEKQPPTAPRSKWSNAGSPTGSYASLPGQAREALPSLSPPSGPRNLPTGPRTSVPPSSGPPASFSMRGRGRGTYIGRSGRGGFVPVSSEPRGNAGPVPAPAGPRTDREPPSAPRAFAQGGGRGRGGARYDGIPSGPASMMPRDRGWGNRGGRGGNGGFRGGRGGPYRD